MKKTSCSIALIISLFCMSSLFYIQGPARAVASDSLEKRLAELPKEQISATERENLLHLFEVQKLIRDVYAKFYTLWNLHDFKVQKMKKEGQLQAMLTLLRKYNLDPGIDLERQGVFVRDTLQKLYSNFVSTGRFSLFEALRISATMEDLNIYQAFDLLHLTDNQDLRLICRSMTETSRDNLSAIKDLLDSYGEKLGGNIWMW